MYYVDSSYILFYSILLNRIYSFWKELFESNNLYSTSAVVISLICRYLFSSTILIALSIPRLVSSTLPFHLSSPLLSLFVSSQLISFISFMRSVYFLSLSSLILPLLLFFLLSTFSSTSSSSSSFLYFFFFFSFFFFLPDRGPCPSTKYYQQLWEHRQLINKMNHRIYLPFYFHDHHLVPHQSFHQFHFSYLFHSYLEFYSSHHYYY